MFRTQTREDGAMIVELQALWKLGLALLLSSAIGIERELRQKSAGLRTHTLVGLGSALFMLVSQYGFADAVTGDIDLDPSRMAAQIVSGIGFIGAGIIFVRRDAVRGLTTAAAVWVTAAVGTAAGGGLPVLAVATTLAYFLVAYGYPRLVHVLPTSVWAPSLVRVTYLDGRGLLRDVLARCVAAGFQVVDVSFRPSRQPHAVDAELRVRGTGSVAELASQLDEPEGVLSVHAGDDHAEE
jgi:putative Mg2+ transporter-C (MgtC) family protein